MYYIYAIYQRKESKIYVGQTDNLQRRLTEHNSENKHYTGKIVGQWELIYQEAVQSKSAAIAREKQLKSYQGRQFLKSKLNSPG